jgi:hypothetical protein
MRIHLDPLQEETLRGYLGELLASPDTPEQDLPILESIYIQTLTSVCDHPSTIIWNEQGETNCLHCGELNV